MEITISNHEGTLAHTIVAPDERRDARTLWAFLVGNLRPGLQVQLEDGTGQIVRASGEKVPVHLYERLLGGARLDEVE